MSQVIAAVQILNAEPQKGIFCVMISARSDHIQYESPHTSILSVYCSQYPDAHMLQRRFPHTGVLPVSARQRELWGHGSGGNKAASTQWVRSSTHVSPLLLCGV